MTSEHFEMKTSALNIRSNKQIKHYPDDKANQGEENINPEHWMKQTMQTLSWQSNGVWFVVINLSSGHTIQCVTHIMTSSTHDNIVLDRWYCFRSSIVLSDSLNYFL